MGIFRIFYTWEDFFPLSISEDFFPLSISYNIRKDICTKNIDVRGKVVSLPNSFSGNYSFSRIIINKNIERHIINGFYNDFGNLYREPNGDKVFLNKVPF